MALSSVWAPSFEFRDVSGTLRLSWVRTREAALRVGVPEAWQDGARIIFLAFSRQWSECHFITYC